MNNYNFWFIVGSQFLYGDETLKKVAANSQTIVRFLNDCGKLPAPVRYQTTVVTAESALSVVKQANYDDSCAGIIVFCHTFSPSKMWINALAKLQKPYLHLHTQFNETIPNQEIDMDYMNLHQSAHGDREHGFITARMGIPRKVVAGYWQDDKVIAALAKWMRAAVGAQYSQALKVMRFGDNMREVAVTEGDKVEAQIKLGWQVNTYPVGALVAEMATISEKEIDGKMAEYTQRYNMATSETATVRYQAREELAIRKLMQQQGCQAFSNTFEDLYGMDQLPGLASQNIMADGFGYGGEGDWKVAALTAVCKAMAEGIGRGTSFMEDYTYDIKNGLSLGAHMLEVCPSLAADKPRIEVHELGIGGKQAPARLVFEGKAGPAILTTLIDMGDHFRLLVHDIDCVEPNQTMPNLPVARVMWLPQPDLATGAHCWILAGGAHHAVLSYDLDAEILRDWARIMKIEFVHISKTTVPEVLEDQLALSGLLWSRK